MRPVLVAAVLSLVVVACSSSADDAAEDCPIVGTYNVTLTAESGDCAEGSSEATYTITANGSAYAVQLPGLQGACPLEAIGSCKAQGHCEVHGTDALDPNNSVGTVQFAWTFTSGGFTGSNTVALPAAKSLPNGCNGRASLNATRL